MRFKRVELSPANKRQYVIALGVKDIELLLGEARNAARYMPNVGSNKPDRERLDGIRKGLEEAYAIAKQDGDEGDKVPMAERVKYKHAREENPMLEVTRLEIIDHRPCKVCEGKGIVAGFICDNCDGRGAFGREVLFFDSSTEVASSVQDEGRTLKLFIGDRKHKTAKQIIFENTIQKPFFDGDPKEFIKKMIEMLDL